MTKPKIFKNLILITVIIIMVIIFLYSLFYSDYKVCRYEFSILDCASNYLKYILYTFFGNCYIKNVEPKGNTNETHNLLLDVYLVNLKNYDEEDVSHLIDSTNNIWKEYNISFYVNSVTKINNSNLAKLIINDENELYKFFKNAVDDKLLEDDIIDLIIIEKIFEKQNILLWPYLSDGTEGQGLKNIKNKTVNIILLSFNAKNISWNLAHETGHILGLLDKAFYSGQMNLMTHTGCIKDNYYPIILNQSQLDTILSVSRSLAHFRE